MTTGTTMGTTVERKTADSGGVVVEPEAATAYNVFGLPVAVSLPGEVTGGAYAAYTITVPPGLGSPPHCHSFDDEAFTVLEGTFEVACGETATMAQAGTTVFLPRGVPHAFRNVGAETGRLAGTASPAGHEHFFHDVDALGERALTDMDAAIEVCRRHGIALLMPEA